MCRRFALDLEWDAVASQFAVDEADVRADNLPQPSYNIAPKQTIALVAQGKDGRRHLTGAYWSLVPRWSVSKTLSYPTYNARVESARDKPSFADSTRSMRAIIPASGYYEWHGKQPFYFHAPNDALLPMAGLYSWWRPSPATPWQLTATIITCPAADEFAEIHDRMPLLVPRHLAATWLDRTIDGASWLAGVRNSGTALSRRLQFHEVAPLQGDGKCLIQPLDSTEPIRLF